jgi:uncharacterized membrane protein
MFDFLIPLFSCVGLAVVALLLIVPFIALYRTRRLEEVLVRLRRLERDLESLRETPPTKEPPPAAVSPIAPPQVAAPAAETTFERVADAEPIIDPSPPSSPRQPRKPRPPEWTSSDFEQWLGARGLGWAAVILLLFATAFFFRELFERDLIGELGRVAIGIGFGLLAILAGYRQHRRGWPITAQMLTAAGVVLLYLSVFATFGFYQLMPQSRAGIFLVVIVIEAFGLALAYDAPAVAILAVIGGLLTPVLLHTEQDRYIALFEYLTALNAGVVVTLLIRRWWGLSAVTLLGTHLLFWVWYFDSYHPVKLTAVLLFQLGLAATWTGYLLAGPLHRYSGTNLEDQLRLIAQTLLLTAAGYVVLDEKIHEWMATLALAMAVVHTVLTWVVLKRRPSDGIHAFLHLALAMGFIASAMPLQARAPWVAVGWAVQGLLLWWFSLRIRNVPIQSMGLAFLAAAVVRFFYVQVPLGMRRDPFVPIFNEMALTALAIIACLLIAAMLVRRGRAPVDSPNFVLGRVVGFVGLFLLWVLLSDEVYDYFRVQEDVSNPAVRALLSPREREMNVAENSLWFEERRLALERKAQVGLSIVWGLYGIALLAIGLRLPSRPLRWTALSLFAITLTKVFTVDMDRLPGLYRVAAFFGLSVLLGAAAWAYQKVTRSLLAEEETAHA